MKNMKDIFKKYVGKNKKKEGWIGGFDKTKSIFIHVPKTAGTSIALSFYGEDPWHYDIKYYRDNYFKKFNKYTKFAFVRNPYDRLFSSYRYSFLQYQRNKFTNVAFVTEYSTFKEFVETWLTRKSAKSHYFFKPQVDYLCDENRNLLIDYVGRFECLYDDYDIISNKLNLTNILPTSNSSGEKLDIKEFYDDKMIDIVKDVYKEDLDFFEYEFIF